MALVFTTEDEGLCLLGKIDLPEDVLAKIKLVSLLAGRKLAVAGAPSTGGGSNKKMEGEISDDDDFSSDDFQDAPEDGPTEN